MDLSRISPPLTRQQKLAVVSLEEVKAQARVTHDAEDDLIRHYIEAAYDYLSGPDGWLNGYCLLAETYEFFAAAIPRDGLDLPVRPLRAVVSPVSIEVRDAAGAYSDLAPSLFYTRSGAGSPRIERATMLGWPVPSSLAHLQTYRITVLAGHASAAEVPSPIKLAIKMLAGTWYANREVVGPAGRAAGQAVPFGLTALCGRFRLAHDHS